jgi:uncharacterized SAM-binding protein YcdF (DUF218 family)
MLGAVAAGVAVAVLFTPLPNLVNGWMAGAGAPGPAQAIVVLGAGGVEADGTLSLSSLQRTARALDLYRRRLAPLVVFSGPSLRRGGPAEAEVRAAYARQCGVPIEAILVESRGRTTREEAARLAALLLPRGIRTILLVVDAQGVPRARGVFARAGFDVHPVPTDDLAGFTGGPEERLEMSRRMAMEALAWLYYWTAGYL